MEMSNSNKRINTMEFNSGHSKQVVFMDTESETLPAMNISNDQLKRTMIVQHFRSNSDDRFQSPVITPNIHSKKPSILQRRLNDNSTNVRQCVDNTNIIQRTELSQQQLMIISSFALNTKENKQESELVKFRKQKSVLNRSDSVNGTINTMNDTVTSELETMSSTRSKMELQKEQKTIENQATLDLLDKIRHSTNAAPIGPMPLSQQACRFELPFDLKLLEALTPLDYLSKYCRLSSRRQYQFKRIFGKYRNREHCFESSYLYLSMSDIHKENLTRPIFDYLCQLIDLGNEQYQFTFDTYAGILAFCERILFNSSPLYNDHDDYNLTKNAIEKCDFYSLDRKLDGLVVNDTLKRLLNAL